MGAVAIVLTGAWRKAEGLTLGFSGQLNAAYKKAALQEGHFLRNEIVRGIRSGAPGGKSFLPLSEKTLAVRRFKGRGGSKPLVVSGELARSVTVKAEGDEVFVGLLRSGSARGGKSMANLGEIHEFGKTFAMVLTPKARRFLAMAFRSSGIDAGGSSTGSRGGVAVAVIVIPPRPFLTPVFEQQGRPELVRARFEKRLAAALRFQFGTP